MRDAVTTLAAENSRHSTSGDPIRAAARMHLHRTSDRVDSSTLLGELRDILGGVNTTWLRRLEPALACPGSASREVVSAVRTGTSYLRRADDQFGGGIRSAAECHLTIAARLLAAEQPGPVQQGLAQAVGDVAQLAGWLAFDGGNNQTAENHYRTGLRAAHLAEDHLLSAYLVAHTAHLLANLRETGEALAATTIIRRLTARQTTPATQAYAAAVEADIHGRRGDQGQAIRALDRAERWVGRIVPASEPSWLYYFDRAELLAWRGEVGMRLALPTMAREALHERLALLGDNLPRERAFATADLASAYVMERNLDDGVALACEALELARVVGSARVVDRVTRLRRQVQSYAGAHCVRRLDEELRTARLSA